MPDEKTDATEMTQDGDGTQEEQEAPENPYDITDPEDEGVPPENQGEGDAADGGDAGEAEGEGGDDDSAVLSEGLIQRAEDAGIPRELAQSIGKADVLERVIATMPQKAPEKDTQESVIEQEEKPFDVALDPEEYGREFVEQQKACAAHVDARINALREGWQKERDEERARDAIARFDAIANDASEYEKLLGKGNAADMDVNSTEYKNREKLFGEMEMRRSHRAMTGQAPLSDTELFRLATLVTFPEQITETARSKLESSLKKRKGQLTVPPQSRTTKKAGTPEQRARMAVADKLADLNIDTTGAGIDETGDDIF